MLSASRQPPVFSTGAFNTAKVTCEDPVDGARCDCEPPARFLVSSISSGRSADRSVAEELFEFANMTRNLLQSNNLSRVCKSDRIWRVTFGVFRTPVC